MKRVRARALALVNWKGVFYQRYSLDENVTALEGVNGSGKTTVMIAAYVVLLPDMTRLRFTNLGESGAIGGDRGIYGRLGESGRPSYACLDLVLADGQRAVAGVRLERKSEPTVELAPFLISGLAREVRLHDVLLERRDLDEVPDLPRLRELVALAGGKLTTFNTNRDYFAALFERGVLPMRLATEEERNRLHDMLRTSMVGGISKALTGGLRDFLLREESGLADTLKRMSANLDACRKTRLQVEEARVLEREIRGVYEAGGRMFAAALHATRMTAEELDRRLAAARVRLDEARARAEEAVEDARHRSEAHAAAEQAHAEDRQRLEDAEAELRRTREANAIQRRILERESERASAEAREAADRTALEEAEASRHGCDREHRTAAGDRDRAAEGLAEFHRGFQELERRAALFADVTERLEAARAALPDQPVEAGALAPVRQRLAQRIGALDAESVRLERELATAACHAEDFAGVRDAVVRLETALAAAVAHREAAAATPEAAPAHPEAVEAHPEAAADAEAALAERDPARAYPRAQRLLAELRRLDLLAAEGDALPQQVAEAREQARLQAAAREAARGLDLATADAVRAAFEATERAIPTLVETRHAHEQAAADHERARRDLEAQARALEELRARWLPAHEAARRLGSHWQRAAASRDDLRALHEHVQSERDRAQSEAEACDRQRRRVEAELHALERGGGHFSEALLRARDRAEGELLAGRFEDVDVEEAGRLQALLGPLHEAVLVEDAAAAAERLRAHPDGPDTVWLVDGGSVLPLDDSGRPRGDVEAETAVVPGETAWRLTRVPGQPTLGRRAREHRIHSLRRDEQRLQAEHEAAAARVRAAEAGLREIHELLPDALLLARTDPQDELPAAWQQAAQAEEARDRSQEAARALRRQVEEAEARRRDLSRLLPRAHLLDADDVAAAAERLAARLEAARRARRLLYETSADRARVENELDVLRRVPLSEAAQEAMRRHREQVDAERDALAVPARHLAFVDANAYALAWSDAPPALREQKALAPALTAQLEAARERLERAQAALDEAESRRDAARAAYEAARAALQVLEQYLRRDREALAVTGCADAGDAALQAAERRATELLAREAAAQAEVRRLRDAVVRAEERRDRAREEMEQRAAEVAPIEAEWRPARERMIRLDARAGEQGVLAGAVSPEALREVAGLSSSVQSWQAAQRQQAVLVERLEHARDAAELLAAIRGGVDAPGDPPSGERYLEAWLQARNWLRRRVPPQIAEVDEPLEAMQRLGEHLVRLTERLARQERDLRGQASDVANNIQVQIRRARRQVLALNGDLREVRFGSIRSMQIRVEGVERMERVLTALKEEDAQRLLFSDGLPVEEAMEELFRRFGGGRIGGQRLLDYREYMHLRIDVQRATGEWEEANPTRMSTGEAIGVGAAVMMVVLAAWERDANLFRKARSTGTLRLLFLDEANRLSQDNLGVLFDLCQSLQLQLLIAAPEVARAEGNTTYRLVRQVGADGREEVAVTGRRVVARERAPA